MRMLKSEMFKIGLKFSCQTFKRNIDHLEIWTTTFVFYASKVLHLETADVEKVFLYNIKQTESLNTPEHQRIKYTIWCHFKLQIFKS